MDVGVCIFPVFQKPAYCSYPELRLITIKNPCSRRMPQERVFQNMKSDQ